MIGNLVGLWDRMLGLWESDEILCMGWSGKGFMLQVVSGAMKLGWKRLRIDHARFLLTNTLDGISGWLPCVHIAVKPWNVGVRSAVRQENTFENVQKSLAPRGRPGDRCRCRKMDEFRRPT